MPAQECGLLLSFIGCSVKTKMVLNLKLCPIEVNFQKSNGLKKRKTGLPAKNLRIPNPNNFSPILAT